METTVASLINGDCIIEMENIGPECIDLIIADPPFGIKHFKENVAYNRNSGLVLNGYVEVEEGEYDEFSDRWISQAARILTPEGSMYVVSGWSNLEDVLRALRQNKLTIINHIIWQYAFGVYTKKKFVTSHYHILFVAKNPKSYTFNRECVYGDEIKSDGRSLNYLDRQDVWKINRENWTGKVKTQNKLPMKLVEKMINYSSIPGNIILDPFFGSGQVPFVAKKMARKYIGIEISKQIYEFGKYRVESGDYYEEKFKGEDHV